jgi:hypothetical protein
MEDEGLLQAVGEEAVAVGLNDEIFEFCDRAKSIVEIGGITPDRSRARREGRSDGPRA